MSKLALILLIFNVACRHHTKHVIEVKPINAKLTINVVEVDFSDEDSLDLDSIKNAIEPIVDVYSENVYGVWLVLVYRQEKNHWPKSYDILKAWSLEKKLDNNFFFNKVKSLDILTNDKGETYIDILNSKGIRKRTIITNAKNIVK